MTRGRVAFVPKGQQEDIPLIIDWLDVGKGEKTQIRLC